MSENQFKNTIAFGCFYDIGAEVTLTADTWEAPPVVAQVPVIDSATRVNDLAKNISASSKYNGGNGMEITVHQNGTYMMNLSFVADGGDGKNYEMRGVVDNSATPQMVQPISFYQQNTEQQYEVSVGWNVMLKAEQTFAFELYAATISATDFYLRDVRMSLWNLQQLGMH